MQAWIAAGHYAEALAPIIAGDSTESIKDGTLGKGKVFAKSLRTDSPSEAMRARRGRPAQTSPTLAMRDGRFNEPLAISEMVP